MIYFWYALTHWRISLKFLLGVPVPPFWPKKMTTLAEPMTPLFYCRILFYSKNVDVCKKLELNPLRFDQDIRVLSSIKKFSKFSFFCFVNQNRGSQRVKSPAQHSTFQNARWSKFIHSNLHYATALKVNIYTVSLYT